MKKCLKKMLVCVAAVALALGGVGAMPVAAAAHTVSPLYDNRAQVIANVSTDGDKIYFSARARSSEKITSVTVMVKCDKTTPEGEFVRRKTDRAESTLMPVIASGTMQAEAGYVYTVYATAEVTFADGTKESYTDTISLNY